MPRHRRLSRLRCAKLPQELETPKFELRTQRSTTSIHVVWLNGRRGRESIQADGGGRGGSQSSNFGDDCVCWRCRCLSLAGFCRLEVSPGEVCLAFLKFMWSSCLSFGWSGRARWAGLRPNRGLLLAYDCCKNKKRKLEIDTLEETAAPRWCNRSAPDV